MTKKSKTFPEGQIATDKFARNALEDLYDADPHRDVDPRFDVLRLANKLTVFLSTYIDPIVMAHPFPVCTRYGLVASGRSSSSKPNLQNLPKRDIENDPFKASDIRRCYVPRDGNVFIDADYSTLELRTLAQVCLNLGLNSNMAAALCDGRDLHTDFAAQLLGLDYDHVLDVLANHHDHPDYKRFKKQRDIAKIANFGLPGGLGARGFVIYARGFGTKIDPMQAADLKFAWQQRWPEMDHYFDWIKSLELPDRNFGVPQHGPMRSVEDWRTRCCTRRADKSPYNAACNTPFQGMAADGCKLAMWKITKACYVDRDSPLFGYRPVVFVHDQFVLEGPEQGASAAAHELVRLMKEGMAIMVPDIPIEATVALGRRWDVDMESTVDEHGNLSVYEAAAAA
jgi:DNA polymerase-1